MAGQEWGSCCFHAGLGAGYPLPAARSSAPTIVMLLHHCCAHNRQQQPRHPPCFPHKLSLSLGSEAVLWLTSLLILFLCAGACDAPEALRDPEALEYCNGWQGFSGSIRGVVLFEPSLNEPGSGFNLTGAAFALWLAGHWDSENATLASYQASQVDGGCSSFIKLRQMNGYGWVDYINNSTSGQVRCWDTAVQLQADVVALSGA